MSISIFLELIEVKAKAASVFPFLIGLCFSYYYYGSMRLFLVSLFFVSMLFFNMFGITIMISVMFMIGIISVTPTLLAERLSLKMVKRKSPL